MNLGEFLNAVATDKQLREWAQSEPGKKDETPLLVEHIEGDGSTYPVKAAHFDITGAIILLV